MITLIETKQRSDGTGTVIFQKSYELNSKQVEILRRFKEKGWVEFRNYRYDDVTEEREADLCYELVDMEILESDGMSWHLTFHLTEIGKQVVSQLL